MMKVKIPYELKLKFLSMEGLTLYNDKGKKLVYGRDIYYVILDLKNHPKCLEACVEWNYVIETYFKTSYKPFRIDIGPYKGLWPIIIYPDGTVKFTLDEVDPNRKDWKDWFIKEDLEYAPVFAS
jgi:hypothetical protein